jgi:hypothetical protein
MPVLVGVLLGGMLISMLFIGALATSDQRTRRLMLWIALFSVLVVTALAVWASTVPDTDITNTPTTSPAVIRG